MKTKENAVFSCLFYPSLVLSVRYSVYGHQGGYKQRARCVPSDKQTLFSVQYQQLRLCAYMQNCKGLQSLHTAEATFRLCMLTQDKSTKLSYESYIYSGKELELACAKVATKVCGFTFGSISLPLISKRKS